MNSLSFNRGQLSLLPLNVSRGAFGLALLCIACETYLPAHHREIEYDVVNVRFLRAETAASNPYVTGASFSIRLEYNDCLSELYEREDAPPLSAELIDEWSGTRLCARALEFGCVCKTQAIHQSDDLQSLSVEFWVDGCLENMDIRVGPFPTTETSECREGEQAEVLLVSPDDVRGYDADGMPAWHVDSYSPSKLKVGAVAPFLIRALADE